MTSHDLLEEEVASRLNGDRERVAELFVDRSLLDRLAALTQPYDPRSYAKGRSDGWYFVGNGEYFDVYYQERGSFLPCFHRFDNPREAAIMFFAVTGYTKKVRDFSRGRIFNAMGEITAENKPGPAFVRKLWAGMVGFLGASLFLTGLVMLYFTLGQPNALIAGAFLIGVGAVCLFISARSFRNR